MAIDFTLSDSQRELQASARDFAENTLGPMVEGTAKMTFALGLMHKDVKPHNILFDAATGSSRSPKVRAR